MIAPIYTAALAVLFVVLSVRTLRIRRKLGVAVGHGDSDLLLRAMRAHSNFAEYVPLTLLTIFFAETRAAETWSIHAMCACLLVGRVIHGYGISQTRENGRWRVAGMALTFTSLISATSRLTWSYL